MNILNIVRGKLYPGLYEKLEPYRVNDPAQLPFVYQPYGLNPAGRPYHDDWAFLKRTSRLETAYRAPLPFKMIAGNATMVERPLPMDYPLTPGVAFEVRPWYDGVNNVDKKWVWMVDPIQPAGCWAELAVWLPEGVWFPCYSTSSFNFLGNKVPIYYGLRHDPHPVDACCWFPEVSISVKWRSKE